MILEYKMCRTDQGMKVPSWVQDGGYYSKASDFSWVGWSPDNNVREWYIPDTVVVLTNSQFIARVVALKPSSQSVDAATAEANAWITDRS